MKLIAFILCFCVSNTLLAAFDGAQIDLTKFESAAKKELLASGLSEEGKIYFQDGFIPDKSTNVSEDLAELYFVSENMLQNFNVVFVLNLATGTVELKFLSVSESNRTEATLGMVFSFDKAVDTSLVESDVLKKFPALSTVKIGSSILNVYSENFSGFNEIQLAVEYIQKTYSPANFYLNKYFAAFDQPTFGKLQELKENTMADLDLLRDVVPSHIKNGGTFDSPTSVIPEGLKPN